MDVKYFECHITISPVFDERLEEFSVLCKNQRFKPAKLLLQKDRLSTPERSDKDTFSTGHSKTFEDLHERMTNLLHDLKAAGFEVWRYKIEAILLDERSI